MRHVSVKLRRDLENAAIVHGFVGGFLVTARNEDEPVGQSDHGWVGEVEQVVNIGIHFDGHVG